LKIDSEDIYQPFYQRPIQLNNKIIDSEKYIIISLLD